MESIRQNLFTKASALHFASTVGIGLIPSCFTPITMKECALIGSVTGSLTAFGHAFVGKDATTFKKILITVGSFGITFFSVTKFTPLLNARFAVQLYPGAILQVLVFNALGQVASFAITKYYLTTPWNMSDEQITALHAKYEKKPELFEKHSSVEQLLLWHRFNELGLKNSFYDKDPSKEEIQALTDEQIRILHQHEAYLTEDEVNEALLLRYFALNLPPFDDIEDEISKITLKIPNTTQDLEGIKDQQFKWYAIYFEKNAKALKALSYPLQWALYEKGGAQTYYFDAEYLKTAPEAQIRDLMNEAPLTWWVTIDPVEQAALIDRAVGFKIEVPYPAHPKTAEEVRSLKIEVLKAYHKKLHKDLGSEAIQAFNLRFYEFNLPLPNGIDTIDKLKKEGLPFPLIAIELPKSIEEVKHLHNHQLPWVYARCANHFSTLSFEIQSALNERFWNTQASWHYLFSLGKLTADNIGKAGELTIKILSGDLSNQLDEWIALDPSIRGAFIAKLKSDPFTAETFKTVQTTTLSKDAATRYHTFFNGTGNPLWKNLGNKQATFNVAFGNHSLPPIAP
ncbi:MAG: hypothetical protein KDK56_07550 [Simkania sp.]|nr:hypothetical protein [Simkania sp.]MCP5490647.1 hypothetical protein [Chlamydiales bacterium]